MFYTYILQSNKAGELYIGCTNDLKDRLKKQVGGRNQIKVMLGNYFADMNPPKLSNE